jgi:hypothetical protein
VEGRVNGNPGDDIAFIRGVYFDFIMILCIPVGIAGAMLIGFEWWGDEATLPLISQIQQQCLATVINGGVIALVISLVALAMRRIERRAKQ